MASLSALKYIGRGLIFAAIGMAIGVGLGQLIADFTDKPPVQIRVAIGYVFTLFGWLFGVGLWEVMGRGWFGLETRDQAAAGWQRYFSFSLDHKVIGVQYLVTFVILFLLGGAMAMLLRVELLDPGKIVLDSSQFNTAMSLHGIIMVAVAVATILGGFANFLVPIMIGADDVAFPRINAMSYWIVPPVAVMLLLTPLFGGFDSGWTAYPPLSVVNADGQLFMLLAFLTFGFSSILGGLNFVTTIIALRAPGMTMGRLPIFVWSIFAAALISLTATQVVAFGLLMVILDRVAGLAFFNAAAGGSALLYEHVFWFYSHPAVYIMVLPGLGLLLEILSHFSRKPVFAYKLVVAAFLSIVVLGYLVWAHHLFTSGMDDFLHLPFMVMTELISIPTGVVFLSALGTIWMGKLWLQTPMLFALGVVFNFLIGGITGIFLADVATDVNLQDTYFVVAHFHYTMMGGEIFILFGAIYYWFPKITGRMYDETMGKIHFWWMFVAYNVLFMTLFWVGVQGMNRRVASYPTEFITPNVIASVVAFVLGASFLVFVLNMIRSWVRGPVAGDNPWGARTLEWQTSSPPPHENFDYPPVITDDPYGYGDPASVHAIIQPLAAPEPSSGGAGDAD